MLGGVGSISQVDVPCVLQMIVFQHIQVQPIDLGKNASWIIVHFLTRRIKTNSDVIICSLYSTCGSRSTVRSYHVHTRTEGRYFCRSLDSKIYHR